MDIDLFLAHNVPAFMGLSQRERASLVSQSKVAVFEAHEAIIEFGAESAFVGVLLEGRAEISITLDDGERKTIERLAPGGVFGELSLLSNERSTMDVTAVTRSTVLLIPPALLSEIMTGHPDAVKAFSAVITARHKAIRPCDWEHALRNAAQKNIDPYGLSLRKPGAPMTILAVSYSGDELDYALYNTAVGTAAASGRFHDLGSDRSHLVFRSGGREKRLPVLKRDLRSVFALLLDTLVKKGCGVIGAPGDIDAVGHHIVSGGDIFQEPIVAVKDALGALSALSPHLQALNAPGLAALEEARRLFPGAQHVAVFDSSFHSTMPPFASLFALPYELYKEKGVRRYGFHGLAHQYAALAAARCLKRPFRELEIAVCFLDREASVCAVDHGRSMDVSAGFSPAEGLVTARSPGSIDPAVLFSLCEQGGFSFKEVSIIVREQGGLAGLAGVPSDIEEIEAHAEGGHHRALLAYKLYGYSIRKKIGEAQAAMGGLDALVFTGAYGRASAGIRSLACQGLGCMGIFLDEKRNAGPFDSDETVVISRPDSPVKILVVPPDPTLMLARETLRALKTDGAAGILKKQENMSVPIEVSARHVHLCQAHIEALFGAGAELEVEHELSQPGRFAAKQQVTLSGPKGSIEGVRVIGPARGKTQVEIAISEQFTLGIAPPVRESGDLEGTPGLTIEGPAGSVVIDKGVICALRHIHLSPADALSFGLHDRDVVRVRVSGDRELVFGDVLVRVRPDYRLVMHIDTDEANASHLKTGDVGYIEGIQSRE